MIVPRFPVLPPGKGHAHASKRGGGQSLVEFALLLPLVMLLILVGLDLGRAFMTKIALNNTVRIGANFAAQRPDAWGTSPDTAAQDRYEALITNEWAGIDCIPPPVPDPVFPSGKDVGDPVTVEITCDFVPITPLLSNIVPSVPVTSSAVFPIRAGEIGSGGTGSGMCTVPSFVGTDTAGAQATWTGAGFESSVLFDPFPPPDYAIEQQSVSSGTLHWCDNTLITVGAPTCTVPDLSGLDTTLAQAEWDAANFTSSVTFDPVVPPDYPISDQLPAPGTLQSCASGVVVTGNQGPCSVPNFNGTSTADAQATWAGAFFRTAVTFSPAGPLPYTITGQSLLAGSDQSCATATIELSGNPTCTVPRLINAQPAEAQTIWNDAGFNPGNMIWNPLPTGDGRVRSQTPGEGTVGDCATQTVTVSQNR